MKHASNESWFKKNEERVVHSLGAALTSAIHAIGDNAKCIYWFCSKAEQNINKKIKKAA